MSVFLAQQMLGKLRFLEFVHCPMFSFLGSRACLEVPKEIYLLLSDVQVHLQDSNPCIARDEKARRLWISLVRIRGDEFQSCVVSVNDKPTFSLFFVLYWRRNNCRR